MKRLKYFIATLILFTMSGCATVPYKPPVIPPKVSGIYHKVQKGETLWKISKAYGTGIKEIAKLNKLPDTSRINTGQLIFIPNAKQRVSAAGSYSTEDNFIWPVSGRVISYFGSLKDGIKNKGIDIASGKGVMVLASRSGKVSFRDDKVKGYGKTVIIDHGDGYSTVYTYNAEILAETGDYVKQGSVIAKVGNTGRADKPSLHFEIRKNHRPQNPFYYLP